MAGLNAKTPGGNPGSESETPIEETNMTTIPISVTSAHEPWEIARKAAQSADCGIENCDGDNHDRCDAPENWSHRIVAETFDDRSVLLDISREPDGTHTANISMESDGDVTAAELRHTADQYDAFPAFLRAQADRLDELNGVKH